MLTALIERPGRLIYLSSGLHRGGEGSLADLHWTKRTWDPAKAYAEIKLQTLALASTLARRWPNVLQPCRRSRLGTYENGRSWRTGRRRDRATNPGLASGKRRPRRDGYRPALVVQDFVEDALSEGGFEAQVARSGDEAFSLFRDNRHNFRALLTDIGIGAERLGARSEGPRDRSGFSDRLHDGQSRRGLEGTGAYRTTF
jgi:hypothetical protein